MTLVTIRYKEGDKISPMHLKDWLKIRKTQRKQEGK